jgi:selenocysteine-specific elongation factor
VDRSVILGTAGHIDHGKTALVKALTGVDADRLPEEKRRGITIDLGFAPLIIDGVGTIGVVDVPGHEGFVRTMLAGASGIDLAMLVVAADEGVMPQTREHLEILSLLRIPTGLIALTKCDTVDEEWRRLVADDIRILCANSPLSDAEIIEVSAVTGENIGELKAAIARAAHKVSRNNLDDLFRLPVDRAFTVKGTGTVVTGTVWTGSIERDQVVRIEPGGKTARVRAIQSHGHASAEAVPGTRTALALAGIDVDDVERGCTIITEPRWTATSEIDVALTITDSDLEPTSRTRLRLHVGTADTGARLSRLKRMNDGHVTARLILDDPIIARGGDRFVVRTASPPRTVGGGEVIDPFPPRKKREVKTGRIEERLASMLDAAGAAGIAIDVLPIRLGLSPAGSTELLEKSEVVRAGPIAVAKQATADLENLLESFTAIHMANHPLEPGVSLQTLRAAAKADPQVIELALSRLEKKNRIERAGSLVRPAGWQSKLDDREQVLSDSILHDLCTGVYEPPSVSDLESKFGKSTGALLRRLERQGQIERVAEDRYYGREPLERMVQKLSSTLVPGRNYSPAELKEVLGVTRKYLIPFLEFCDRKGITERLNEGRQLKLRSNER